MRKLLIILFLIPLAAQSQTVDNAVKQIMKPQIDSIKASISVIPTTPSNVYWDTLYIVNVVRGGNIDTLSAPGIYQLTVTGSLSGVRVVYVAKSATGAYSIRTANPLTLSGTGTFTTSVVNNQVIVSTTATNIIYQRQKL
jgi:hypothetical protein